MILFKNYYINTTKDIDVISVIHEVNRSVREANVPKGIVIVSIPEAGAGIAVLEMLPEIVKNFKEALAIFPGRDVETKNKRKEDVAVWPKIASSILGRSLSLPVNAGRVVLSPREEIVLVDMESGGRRREFCVEIIGEAADEGADKQTPRQGAKRR